MLSKWFGNLAVQHPGAWHLNRGPVFKWLNTELPLSWVVAYSNGRYLSITRLLKICKLNGSIVRMPNIWIFTVSITKKKKIMTNFISQSLYRKTGLKFILNIFSVGINIRVGLGKLLCIKREKLLLGTIQEGLLSMFAEKQLEQ